ncbi:alkanesulfonate monooxygenase, partial [Streptomyces sp. SID625]|nr:alkanesulfonate monooxygenase [Streptomyces sp. SID625]
LLDDAIDFGRYVIPLVREEVARRDAARAGAGAADAVGQGSRVPAQAGERA